MLLTRAAAVAIAAFAALNGGAQEAKSHRWTITEENDVRPFSWIDDRDRHYTQGIRFQFLFPEGEMPRAGRLIAAKLPKRLGRCGEGKVTCSAGFSLGQNIYTPQDISKTELQTDERPYAAWLYGGLLVHVRGPKWLQTVEIDVGTMGDRALGRPIQTGWHDLWNFPPPQGWRNQLRNEPAVMVQYFVDRRWPLAGRPRSWSADLVARGGGVAGNVMTYGSIAPVLRAGFNMSSDFSREIPEILLNRAESRPLEAYVFGGVEARGVVLNELLSGNCCASPPSHGVPLKHGIGMAYWGFAVRGGPVRFQWRQLHRSREFVGQKQSDIYGVLSLAYDRRF